MVAYQIVLLLLSVFLCTVTFLCIFIWKKLKRLEKTNQEKKEPVGKKAPLESKVDQLTGLLCEQEFDEAAQAVLELRGCKDLYILHIDIDNFSFYRSVHGKEAADTALKYVAFCIQDFFDGRILACRNLSDHFYLLAEGEPSKAFETIL